MTTKLFIDDERMPPSSHDNTSWDVVRSSLEAIQYMMDHGCPMFISFDHDLGGDDTAMRVVKWMVERDIDTDGQFMPQGFTFVVHSQNPIGAANISNMLHRWIKEKSIRYDEQ